MLVGKFHVFLASSILGWNSTGASIYINECHIVSKTIIALDTSTLKYL